MSVLKSKSCSSPHGEKRRWEKPLAFHRLISSPTPILSSPAFNSKDCRLLIYQQMLAILSFLLLSILSFVVNISYPSSPLRSLTISQTLLHLIPQGTYLGWQVYNHICPALFLFYVFFFYHHSLLQCCTTSMTAPNLALMRKMAPAFRFNMAVEVWKDFLALIQWR